MKKYLKSKYPKCLKSAVALIGTFSYPAAALQNRVLP
jgi:hypothetical protein